MPQTDARRKATAAYQKRQDNIMIRPSKERGAVIRAAAAAEGQSVQAFILRVLEEYISAHGLHTVGGDQASTERDSADQDEKSGGGQ